ncbi:MAG: cohesin domain-containing protein [Bacteroidales bacterium]|nr:cohesin domain-containing protein [Bacteroidales bacterium]MDD3665859.1 cohesin domain-containing protein [Bacteroidales bacterium]
MKNLILLFVLVVLSIASYADIVVTLPTTTATPGTTINVPVVITGADAGNGGTAIAMSDIRFTFITSVLTYTGVTNFSPLMNPADWLYNGNNTNGLFAGNWIEPNENAISLPDGTTLFEVQFTVVQGISALSFVSGYPVFADAAYNPITSSGINGLITGKIAEPSNFATNFSAHNIILNWTDATGELAPNGYLIRMSDQGFPYITNPVDGTPVADSQTDKNVSTGIQQTIFSGLTPNTVYYFKIFPYRGTGSIIDYKTDGTIPEIQLSTAE